MAPTDPLERKAMGLQAALAGSAASCLRADGAPPRRGFHLLDEGQTRRLLQGAGFAAAHRFFQALGFHGWLAQRQ
jgi:tRNA (cmo5U34)-methyltransferase